MTPEEIGQFLANVRQKSFVDYLDPMGETAQAALDRRIRWATMSRRDPAHADEAEFILRHEDALKKVIVEELTSGSDDWLEDGDDDGGGDSWGVNNWGGADKPNRTPKPAERLDQEAVPQTSGLTRLEDLTDPPAPPRIDTPTASAGTPQRDTSALEVRPGSYSNAASTGGQQDVGWSKWDDDEEAAEPKNPYVVDEYSSSPTPVSNRREQAPPPLPRNFRAESSTPTPDSVGPRNAMDIRGSRKPDEKALQARDVALKDIEINKDSKVGKWVIAPLAVFVFVSTYLSFWWIPTYLASYYPPVVATVEVPEPAPVVVEEPDGELADGELADGELADGELADGEEPDGTDAADTVATTAPSPAPSGTASPAPSEASRPGSPSPSPTPAPSPAPAPAPAPAPVAAPSPAPAPVVAPVPEPQGDYASVVGKWSGMAAGKSIELLVESQNGAAFVGTVRLMNTPGVYDSFEVLGKVKPDKSISFAQTGGGPSFYGTVGGIQIKGTAKLPDQEPGKLSLIK